MPVDFAELPEKTQVQSNFAVDNVYPSNVMDLNLEFVFTKVNHIIAVLNHKDSLIYLG